MAQYYNTRPRAIPLQNNPVTPDDDDDPSVLSEFDKHRETLLTADAEEGWASELRRYIGTMQREVTKNTDLVEWWQVSNEFPWNLFTHLSLFRRTMQNYILHSHVLHSTCSHLKLRPFPASGCFPAANKLRQTVGRA